MSPASLSGASVENKERSPTEAKKEAETNTSSGRSFDEWFWAATPGPKPGEDQADRQDAMASRRARLHAMQLERRNKRKWTDLVTHDREAISGSTGHEVKADQSIRGNETKPRLSSIVKGLMQENGTPRFR